MHLHERSKRVMAQGFTGTNSKRYTQYTSAHPKYVVKADKCYVWNERGKKLVDFVSGLGVSVLGYNHPKINEAVLEQIRAGVVTASFPSPLEVEVAELIQSLIPCAERIRFLKTGSEACTAAVRIARAKTGMKYVYTEGYHGWHDIFTSLTPPAKGIKDDFNIRPITDGFDWPGAVIVEPVRLMLSEARAHELMHLKEICRDRGTVLIFDEIVTGMRVPKYCVANHFDVQPDMILLGKGIANGLPLSVVAGRREIMDQDDYFVSSTFSGEALSLAACKATINELKRKSIKDLLFYGERILTQLNSLDDDIKFEGYGTRAMLNITHPKCALFAQECAKAGVLFGKAWFFNFAHLEENIEEYVLNICYDVVTKMRGKRSTYQGEMPRETFAR